MPIYSSEADWSDGQPVAWLGIVQEGEIGRRKSPDDLNTAYRLFSSQSEAKIRDGDYSRYLCFERVEKWADDYDEFMKALRVTDLTDSEPIILLGMYSLYDYRGVELLQSLVTALLVVLGGWFLLSTTPSTNLKELQRIKERKPDLMAKIERLEWFGLIIPHKEWVVTSIILIINAIVYFLMVFSGKGFLTFQADDLISWGTCYAPLVRGGEWWRLLTASFLHGV